MFQGHAGIQLTAMTSSLRIDLESKESDSAFLHVFHSRPVNVCVGYEQKQPVSCRRKYVHSLLGIPLTIGDAMKQVLDWLAANHDSLRRNLADLVAVPSISTDGHHQEEIEQAAALTCEHMHRAGLQNVEILRSGGSNPYAYAEWLGAPGKPTVFLYAHHDVQPVNFVEQWQSDPWRMTARDGRLFGRGTADDKGAITAQLGAVAAFLKTRGSLPINVKMLVEGEEEASSSHPEDFLIQEHKRRFNLT